MDHHYYTLSTNFSEVVPSARLIASGNNNLSDILKRNGYKIQYIHQGTYLLLHGCSADHCFPEKKISAHSGAKQILKRILGIKKSEWKKYDIDLLARELEVLLNENSVQQSPTFQYIHMHYPDHSYSKAAGICDMKTEKKIYGVRVQYANKILSYFIGRITSADPSAVIVVVGDHGPIITNQCLRETDLNTIDGYRDRAGAFLAIRWPKGYDGRYDQDVMTTVNLFKYILASLSEDDSIALDSLVEDDVFIRGTNNYLKIIDDGSFVLPPETLTKEQMKEAYLDHTKH